MDVILVNHGAIKALTPQVMSIDASNAERFKARMREHLENGVLLVLNLERVNLLDSAGLGAMVWLLREAESRGGQVRLCGLQKPVRLLLEVVRMHRVFDIYPDTFKRSEAGRMRHDVLTRPMVDIRKRLLSRAAGGDLCA